MLDPIDRELLLNMYTGRYELLTKSILKSRENPYKFAVHVGDTQILEYLLQEKSNFPRWMVEEGLCLAVEKEKCSLVKIFLNHGVDPKIYNHHLLYMAVDYNNLDLVKLLVEHGCHVGYRSHMGDTPLLYALKLGRNRITKYMTSR